MDESEGFLDFERMRTIGARSLRDYICRVLFSAVTKEGYTLKDVAEVWDIPYELVVRYKSGSIPMPARHIMKINFLFGGVNQTDLVPIRTLTKDEKFRLWQQSEAEGIRPLTACPLEENIDEFFKHRHEQDICIEAIEFQPALVACKLQRRLDDPNYDVLVPQKE